MIVDPDGKNLRQLTTLETYSSPTWSPDGRAILFLSRREPMTAEDEFFVVDTRSGKSRPLGDPGVHGIEPD